MRAIEAPNHVHPRWNEISVFLAGGITRCPNWQKEFIDSFDGSLPVVLMNPRRAIWESGPETSKIQIEWEYDYLNSADIVIFWFCAGTLNPIVLYELGFQLAKRRFGSPELVSKFPTLLIGADPGYLRRDDVVIQTQLADPRLEIRDSLEDLITATKTEIRRRMEARSF